jgi:hypothetical protein
LSANRHQRATFRAVVAVEGAARESGREPIQDFVAPLQYRITQLAVVGAQVLDQVCDIQSQAMERISESVEWST